MTFDRRRPRAAATPRLPHPLIACALLACFLAAQADAASSPTAPTAPTAPTSAAGAAGTAVAAGAAQSSDARTGVAVQTVGAGSAGQATSAAPAAQAPAEAPPVEAYRFTFDPHLNDQMLGQVQITRANQADTLSDIARRFSIGYNEIQRANPGVDMWLPGAGRRVVVPTQFVLPNAPYLGIVVNVAQMRLYYFPPRKRGDQQIVYTYPIGIGRVDWKTPSGVTTVVRKVKNPVWVPPADILEEHREEGDPLPAEIRPGPDDPMGNRALYLGWPEYAIHGTNKPIGVGMRVSHGCMHLYPEDILQLYKMVPLGTQVRVVDQPYVSGWYRGELYMEAFGPLEGDPRAGQPVTRQLLEQAMGPHIQQQLRRRHEQVRWDLVMQLARDPEGIPVAITDPDASLGQALANARQVENRLPDGAAWDGRTDLPMDDTTFERALSKLGVTAAPHPTSLQQHASSSSAAPGT